MIVIPLHFSSRFSITLLVLVKRLDLSCDPFSFWPTEEPGDPRRISPMTSLPDFVDSPGASIKLQCPPPNHYCANCVRQIRSSTPHWRYARGMSSELRLSFQRPCSTTLAGLAARWVEGRFFETTERPVRRIIATQ